MTAPIANEYQSTPLLSLAELRVLRAVDERPGVVVSVISSASLYDEQTCEISLRVLEHHELVRPTTIARTGAVSWRITRAGVDQLIATPPSRLRRRRRDCNQLFLGAGR